MSDGLTTMSADTRERILRVADLLDRPGASRRVDVAMAAPGDLALDMAELVGDVRLDGVVESVVDGLLVRGTVAAELSLSCARCLSDLTEDVSVDVVELYTDPAHADPDVEVEAGYEILDDATINLDTLVRDALVPAVPYRPLCAEDCQGLCAQCGINRNEATCDCVDVRTDARWAALEGLQLGEGDTG
jgi:uncharacterized protein